MVQTRSWHGGGLVRCRPVPGRGLCLVGKECGPGKAGLVERHRPFTDDKRLEQRDFSSPGIHDGVIRLTAAQMAALLEGAD